MSIIFVCSNTFLLVNVLYYLIHFTLSYPIVHFINCAFLSSLSCQYFLCATSYGFSFSSFLYNVCQLSYSYSLYTYSRHHVSCDFALCFLALLQCRFDTILLDYFSFAILTVFLVFTCTLPPRG